MRKIHNGVAWTRVIWMGKDGDIQIPIQSSNLDKEIAICFATKSLVPGVFAKHSHIAFSILKIIAFGETSCILGH